MSRSLVLFWAGSSGKIAVDRHWPGHLPSRPRDRATAAVQVPLLAADIGDPLVDKPRPLSAWEASTRRTRER